MACDRLHSKATLDAVRRSGTFLTVFMTSLCCCLVAVFFLVQRRAQVEFSRLENIIQVQRDDLRADLSGLLFKTRALAALVVHSDGHVSGFDEVAGYLAHTRNTDVLALAPAGVVSYVYPLKGHEALLGMNLLDLPYGEASSDSGSHKKISVFGPLQLPDGTVALVGILPVFLKNDADQDRFWGMAFIALRFPQLLDVADLGLIEKQGLSYDILRFDRQKQEWEPIAASARPFDEDAPHLSMPLQFFDANWQFRISYNGAWHEFFENWFYIFSAVLLSLLLASLAQKNRDLAEAHYRLEEMVYKDTLTGALNRRGLFNTMTARVTETQDEKFILYYLDLDLFKSINDTYGHKAGDRVLQHFAAVIQSVAPPDSVFARMGGDEFILVLFSSYTDAQMTVALDKAVATLANGLPDEGLAVPILFSVGRAGYPENGKTLDELLSRADKAMYLDKERRRRHVRQVVRQGSAAGRRSGENV